MFGQVSVAKSCVEATPLFWIIYVKTVDNEIQFCVVTETLS